MKIRRENSRKKEPNDEKVGDLFQRYPDHLLVDVAAVHGVQVHVPFVQGSERRLSHLQPQVKYGVRSPNFIWAPCAQLYSLAETPQPSPPPPIHPHFDSYSRALLISQDGRHLFMIPCLHYNHLVLRNNFFLAELKSFQVRKVLWSRSGIQCCFDPQIRIRQNFCLIVLPQIHFPIT
jgi:hypothetical protein